MNTLPKYRAWLKQEKKLYFVIAINWNFNDVYVKQDDMDVRYEFGKEIELMQWTGLQDAKGQDIYDGDIIQNVATKQIEKVSFYKGAFWTYKTTLEESWNMFVGDIAFQSEVIGNIYKNPELLTNL